MLNQCNFIGNLGADPDMRNTQDGKAIANMTIAVSEKWKDKNSGEQKEKTEWIRCVAYEPLSKVFEKYVKKGSKVFVSGKMQNRKWTDRDGVEKYTTEIIVNELVMLGEKQQNQQSQHEKSKQNGYQPQDDLDDSIPFAWILPFIMSIGMLSNFV